MKEKIKQVLGKTRVAVLAVAAALTVGTASTALAANGQALILGSLNNAATAITKLTGNVAGPSLQIVNPNTGAAATALNLSVASGKPPLTVDATAGKATNLNADKVDGKSANQLLRVSSFSGGSPLAAGTDGTVATTTIGAPAPGFLVIDTSSDVFNDIESDFLRCFIEVDNALVSGSVRYMELNDTQGVNREENCSTNAVVPVSAGTRTVDLGGDVGAPNTTWANTTLSAIYIPFGGTGASPSSAAISSAQEGTLESR